MSKSTLPSKVDGDPDNDNNDAVQLPHDSVTGVSDVSTAEKVRQGHTGDGLNRILIISLAGAAAALAVVVMIFAR